MEATKNKQLSQDAARVLFIYRGLPHTRQWERGERGLQNVMLQQAVKDSDKLVWPAGPNQINQPNQSHQPKSEKNNQTKPTMGAQKTIGRVKPTHNRARYVPQLAGIHTMYQAYVRATGVPGICLYPIPRMAIPGMDEE